MYQDLKERRGDELIVWTFRSLLQNTLQEDVSEFPRTPTHSNTRIVPTELMRC